MLSYFTLVVALLLTVKGADTSCTVADCSARIQELVQTFVCGSADGCLEEVQRQLSGIVPSDAETECAVRRDRFDQTLVAGEWTTFLQL